MRGQTRKRFLTALLTTGIALGGLAAPAGAGAQEDGEYVPFVTDFGAISADEAPAEPFIPFVTDFGRSPSTPPGEIASPAEPVASAADAGLRWRDVGIGAGLGIGVATLVAGAFLAAGSRRPAGGLRHGAGS